MRWIDRERLIHSFKTAIASILGFLLTKIIGFAADQWIVITIIVVMCAQIYVGSGIQKAYLRFLGTLAGCVLAALVIITFGETNLCIAVAIGLSAFIFSYIATGQESLSYAGTLGAVTTAIIMLGQTPTLIFAAERFLEISIGILIATLVSQFFLPIHARTHIHRIQAKTLSQLREYYLTALVDVKPGIRKEDFYELDESIVKTLSTQRQLAKESVREPLGESFDTTQFLQTLFCEKEILRAMDFMHSALMKIKDAGLTQCAALPLFNASVVQTFDALIKIIGKEKSDHIHLPSVATLHQDMQKNLPDSAEENMVYINGFIFSADILINTLKHLAELYRIPVYVGNAE